MAEEFIEDIINATSGAEEKSSSTEPGDKSTLENLSTDSENNNDQSSTQKSNKADSDQNIVSKTSVEELATQLGWRADHDGEDAVDAATYILRSKDIQKSMGKHNKDLKEQLSTMQGSIEALKEHHERVHKAEVKKLQGEIENLKKERKAAIELADVEKVEELDKQIEERQKDLSDPKSNDKANSKDSSNPIFDEWIKENSWYEEDKEMAVFADTVAQQYVGAPVDRIYKIVREKVKEVFPEKFEASSNDGNSNSSVKKPVGPTSPVASSSSKGNKSTFTEADLTPAQISIMNQFVQNKIMTKEQYINDIAKMES